MRMDRRTFLRWTGLGAALAAVPRLAVGALQQERGDTPMAHELPPLPYDYKALEPYYQEKLLRLHHDKHHAAYVKGLNAAEDKLAEMMKSGDYANIKPVCRALAFHGSGHILHSIFWTNMKADGGAPAGDLAGTIKKDFGSQETFTALFTSATNDVEASGWGLLAYRPMDGKLVVLQAERHQDLTQWGVIPVLVCDVWEHAYYLQYENNRLEWIKSFVGHLVNWENVASRLAAARRGAMALTA